MDEVKVSTLICLNWESFVRIILVKNIHCFCSDRPCVPNSGSRKAKLFPPYSKWIMEVWFQISTKNNESNRSKVIELGLIQQGLFSGSIIIHSIFLKRLILENLKFRKYDINFSEYLSRCHARKKITSCKLWNVKNWRKNKFGKTKCFWNAMLSVACAAGLVSRVVFSSPVLTHSMGFSCCLSTINIHTQIIFIKIQRPNSFKLNSIWT